MIDDAGGVQRWNEMDTPHDKHVSDLEQELYADEIGIPMSLLPEEQEDEVSVGVDDTIGVAEEGGIDSDTKSSNINQKL